jgi:hypothetical protein
MEISQFIDAYTRGGNVLCEIKQNLKSYLSLFAGLPKGGFPTVDSVESYETKGITPAAYLQSQGDRGDKAVMFKNGNIGYRGTGQNAPRFNFKTSPPETVSFTPDEWQTLQQMFEAEGEGDSEAGKTEEDLEKDRIAQEKARQNADEQARLDASKQIYAELEQNLPEGYLAGDGYNALKRLSRNMLGFGGVGKMQSVVNQDLPLEQKIEDAYQVKDVALRIMTIGDNLANDRPLTEAQRNFIRDCIRLRGASKKTQSVYTLGGPDCGGELASAGSKVTLRGHIYGVKIGGESSPLFEIMKDLHDKGVAGDERYQTEDGKPLVFWGGGDAARSNQYRSLMGVLNEYGPGMAQEWIKCGRRNITDCPGVVEQIKTMVEDNKDRLDFKLLLFGAKQFGAGKVREEDMEYAGLEVEGTVKLLEQMFDELGETPDESIALAWTVGKLLNQWDSIVSQPAFEKCKWQVVGRGPTGTQPDGTKVNEDARLQACAGMTPDTIMKQVAVNPKFDVSKGREHYSGEEGVVGVSIKLSDGGYEIDLGKATTNVMDGVGEENAEKRANSRRRNSEWAAEVAKKNGVNIGAEEILEKADKYSDGERDAVNAMMGAVLTDLEGTKAVFREKLKSVGYEEGKGWDKLIALAKKANKGDADAAAELRLKLTNSYRNKHKNDEGMRYAMGLEAAMCGMSTQRQPFVIGDGQTGDNYLGLESDVAGQAIAGIFGFGWDSPLQMSVTQTGITFKDSEGRTIGNLNRRFKDGRSNGFFTVSTEWAKEQLTNIGRGGPGEGRGQALGPQVGNSSMKAEDFVRQLQELIKGIDKVFPVEN